MNQALTIEEQATGCMNAHSYKAYASQHGFTHVEVLNWCSSAGDWQFLVSKNKRGPWYVLFQENNYPRAGFSHSINLDRPYFGTLKSVYKQIEAEW
jgi:hypothetical protein